MSDQENNPPRFIKYRRVGKYAYVVDIWRNLVADPFMARNPFDFLSEFESWFGWERSVHLDGRDPIELNIGVDRFRKIREMRRASLERFIDGCCARLVIQGSGGLK